MLYSCSVLHVKHDHLLVLKGGSCCCGGSSGSSVFVVFCGLLCMCLKVSVAAMDVWDGPIGFAVLMKGVCGGGVFKWSGRSCVHSHS